MKLLIIYGTTEGQTRKIANFLKEEAEKQSHKVTICDATDKPSGLAGFDAVIIGASLHGMKYQSSVEHYVKEHQAELNKTTSAFYSVSLTAAGKDKKSWDELEKITQRFLEHAGWKPALVEQVAGALLYTKYDFLKRYIMRLISKKAGGSIDTSQDHEYTDWNKVKAFLGKVLAKAPVKK